ncbi:MAG TPA: hypothetical protein VFA27_14480 [Vicinamibacterales bacterium]|nr:hypothetical protein [Vicinamibacterales bacterium]
MRIRTIAFALALALGVAAAAAAQSTSQAPRTPSARTPTTPRTTAPAPPAPPAPPAAPGEPALAIPPPAPPAPPRKPGQPVNIKIDVTITDQGRAGGSAIKKTVSIVTGDGLNARIRSVANYTGAGNTPLNVDAEPEILSDGKIRVRVVLQYSLPGNVGSGQPAEVPGAGTLRVTDIQENLWLVLENGKPILAAQSADPVGDRQVMIELKATVLR